MPTVSIVVPVYKAEKTLDACVESILAQTFSDFELLLIDDASPDRCPQMCDAWAEKDPRIHALHPAKTGPGPSGARNAGLDAAAAAAFLALLWPRLRRRQAIAVGVAAAVVATALTPVLMPGIPVLIAALVAVVVGGTNWLDRRELPAPEADDVPERGSLP